MRLNLSKVFLKNYNFLWVIPSGWNENTVSFDNIRSLTEWKTVNTTL
ncbi:unnamed protein product [Schistosoma margrebowiei]|uniref:Uncharacterized protein n=1 Tax=Schistosoma margrebowiei TaxID=48269 RepID=A0A183MAQ5_9TREM|nr:unnamed protein product [Schistosoma margrebowiei]